jgi:transposase
VEQLRFCHEAGPTVIKMGAKCEVVAPTLVPVKAGDRVKTDRRDRLKLARNYRAGELTAVWVADAAHGALRDLVRAREAAKQDELRARHRLNKFLLWHGQRSPMGVNAWTMKYLEWVKREVHFEQMAQEATLLDSGAVKSAPHQMRAAIAIVTPGDWRPSVGQRQSYGRTLHV